MSYPHNQSTPTTASQQPRPLRSRAKNKNRRRELRRRWNQGLRAPVVSRPGARFYVTIREGRRVGWLLGPYASHMTAVSNVERGRRLAMALRPDQAAFAAFGTASHPYSLPTVFGR